MLQLLVGLGNPGADYADTRHNAGFAWIDALARQEHADFHNESRFKGLVARMPAGGRTVYLLKPRTFMNLSGQSVGALARYYRIAPEDILVAHDEMDLPPGHVKLKRGGGHAGHNGLRDIQAQLGSADYWRLRIGIGHPQLRQQVLGWVLGRPETSDREAIAEATARSLQTVPDLLRGAMDKATQAMHRSNPAPVQTRAPQAPAPTSTPTN